MPPWKYGIPGYLEAPRITVGILSHDEVLLRLDVAGHRGYDLIDGIDLNQALISYGLDFLRKRGYKKIMPPFFMRWRRLRDWSNSMRNYTRYAVSLFPSGITDLGCVGDRAGRRDISEIIVSPSWPSIQMSGSKAWDAAAYQIRGLFDLLP
jgi:hypothetical protein